MKNVTLMSIIALLSMTSCKAQSNEEAAIRETITAYSKAGDINDAAKLATYLDEHYRIVMNQLFGSTEISVMPKNVYLEKIRTKEYGGDNRKIDIISMILNGNTASAQVIFTGSKMTFASILTLARDANGAWKILSDMPVVK